MAVNLTLEGKNIMKIFMTLALLLSFIAVSFGAENSMKLLGEGRYTFMFMTVYKARLWAVNKDDLYSNTVTLELEYKMNLKGKDIVSQTKKELLKAGIEESKANEWSSLLLPIFPDVKEGDSLMAKFNPINGIKFYLNQEMLLGEVKSIPFSKAFLDIWLGPKSSEPSLRNQLRGGIDD